MRNMVRHGYFVLAKSYSRPSGLCDVTGPNVAPA